MFGKRKTPPPAPKQMYRRYWFDPKPDITTYELALLLAYAGPGEYGQAMAPFSYGFHIPVEHEAEAWFRKEYDVEGMGRHFTATETIIEGPPLA